MWVTNTWVSLQIERMKERLWNNGRGTIDNAHIVDSLGMQIEINKKLLKRIEELERKNRPTPLKGSL